MKSKKKTRIRRNRRSRFSIRKGFVPPKTLEEYHALRPRDQELWSDVGPIVTKVKQGATFAGACREFGRDPRTVQRLAKPALRKRRNGRWAAKRIDRLLRVLQTLTPEGRQEIGIRDSRQSSSLGDYWHAIELYRDTGDSSKVLSFRGKYVIDADGERFPFLTDLGEIDRLGSAGVLSFESLYARVA